jgi:thiamine-phosphate diphosphorylase
MRDCLQVDLSVYLVTDPDMARARDRPVHDTVAAAVAGGVTTVQVRDKQATTTAFLTTVSAVAEVLPAGVALIINDRVDVFLAARAAGIRVTGIHVGQTDLPIATVRELVGKEGIIGLSAATTQEIAAAAADPDRVDYLGIGALHPTATKTDAPPSLGHDGFARLVAASKLPAVAIGGVAVADMPRLRRSGAAGAAVVSGICDAADPEAAARAYADAWAGIESTQS